jgi:CheY-like chemotaxis protein
VQLIDDLLDVSRILRGKISLNIASINLITTVEAAIETVRLAAEVKGIDLKFKVRSGAGEWQGGKVNNTPNAFGDATQSPIHPSTHSPFQIMGDSARLQQIVWNLLTNAVKFTPMGGRVEVKLEQVEINNRDQETWSAAALSPSSSSSPLPTRYAQITVSDTGKGISAEFLPYVFEYFRQEDGKTTRRFGGLGLGLAIVRYLTEQHGEIIHAESAGEDQGATFTVRLPLLENDSLEEGEERDGEHPSAPFSRHAALPLAGLRVLTADDETDIRDLVTFILKQAGAEVRVATSAVDVLMLVEQSVPDLLLCDIGMPDIDGYMLIRQIRVLPPEQGGRIPAIALTAYAGESDQKQALAAGFQQHIAKPVEPEKLMRTVVTLTGKEGRSLNYLKEC